MSSAPRRPAGASPHGPAVTLPAQPAASSALAGTEERPVAFHEVTATSVWHGAILTRRAVNTGAGCGDPDAAASSDQHSPLPRRRNAPPPTCPQQRGGPQQQPQEQKDPISWVPGSQWENQKAETSFTPLWRRPPSRQPFLKGGQRERTVLDAGAHLGPCGLPRAACRLRQALCTVPRDDRLLRLWVTLRDPVEPPPPVSPTEAASSVSVEEPPVSLSGTDTSVFSPGPFLDPDAEHPPGPCSHLTRI